ncbi:hypothetical protein [Microvirga puerhi]|uniref:MFS transporter n=1 Tax=Microvirga puerhi TaxID=2876078 RepID=A0ABS7VK65_9HYPH|nr:hypothetical protein [Microvirga puerhi]MBZ6075353.1 hypothetical protein [Microvirga puerhi]
MTTAPMAPRAGHLDCICAAATGPDADTDGRGTPLLAAAFALSVLSQVLLLGILPLAGLSMSPSKTWAALPYAAFYAGSAVASLPASLLLDALGRRAAFSLGASLGVAGGLILVWSLTQWHFGGLVLGSFWLGVAGGFSLFYRHVTAGPTGKRVQRTLLVFGAATLAGLIAPTLGAFAERFVASQEFVGMAAIAAAAHVGSLALTALLPYGPQRSIAELPHIGISWRSLLVPTLLGALAWFLMTALMGATPIAMVGCGLSVAVPGVIAWHVIAMYAPSLILAARPHTRPATVTAGGCLILASGVFTFVSSGTTAAFSVSAVLIGVGWSLMTVGTTLWIHQRGQPPRWALGFHDGVLLMGALLGALTCSLFA